MEDAEITLVVVALGEAPSPRQQVLGYRKILRHDPCSYCGAPFEHVDHIIGVWDAEDFWTNMTASCRRCNLSKGTRTPLAFMSGLPIGEDRWQREHRRMERFLAA